MVMGLAAIQPEAAIAVAAIAGIVAGGIYLISNSQAIGPAVAQAWGSVKSSISSALDSVKQQIKDWPQETGKELGDVGAAFFNLNKTVDSAMQNAGQAVADGRDKMYQALGSLGDYVGSKWPTSWDQAKKNVEASWSDLTHNVEASTNDLGNFFTQTIPNIIGGLVNGISDGAKAVGDAFGTLWDSAKAEFDKQAGIQSPSTVMAKAGADIVAGLVQGIKDNASQAVNSVVQWAESLLQAVRSALGMNSPSMEFHAIGLGMMEGWQNGIIAGASGVTDAVHGVNRQLLAGPGMAGGGSGWASAAVGGGGAGGAVEVRLTVAGGSDQATAALIQGMFRKGQIKVAAQNVVGAPGGAR
jgi:uncharacterized protein YoxC